MAFGVFQVQTTGASSSAVGGLLGLAMAHVWLCDPVSSGPGNYFKWWEHKESRPCPDSGGSVTGAVATWPYAPLQLGFLPLLATCPALSSLPWGQRFCLGATPRYSLRQPLSWCQDVFRKVQAIDAALWATQSPSPTDNSVCRVKAAAARASEIRGCAC